MYTAPKIVTIMVIKRPHKIRSSFSMRSGTLIYSCPQSSYHKLESHHQRCKKVLKVVGVKDNRVQRAYENFWVMPTFHLNHAIFVSARLKFGTRTCRQETRGRVGGQ